MLQSPQDSQERYLNFTFLKISWSELRHCERSASGEASPASAISQVSSTLSHYDISHRDIVGTALVIWGPSDVRIVVKEQEERKIR